MDYVFILLRNEAFIGVYSSADKAQNAAEQLAATSAYDGIALDGAPVWNCTKDRLRQKYINEQYGFKFTADYHIIKELVL